MTRLTLSGMRMARLSCQLAPSRTMMTCSSGGRVAAKRRRNSLIAADETCGSTRAKSSPAGGGPDGGEDVHPGGIALVAQPRRALPAGPAAVADAPFLAYPGFVLEPERDTLVGVRNGDRRHRGGEPPFLNASNAALSAPGWAGRAFCRE